MKALVLADYKKFAYQEVPTPELNPDEYLNNSLKGRVHSGVRAQNAKQLESKARTHMRYLLNRPVKVKKFFEHPCAAYAA